MKRTIIGILVLTLLISSLASCKETEIIREVVEVEVVREVEVIVEVPTGISQHDYDEVVAELETVEQELVIAEIAAVEAIAECLSTFWHDYNEVMAELEVVKQQLADAERKLADFPMIVEPVVPVVPVLPPVPTTFDPIVTTGSGDKKSPPFTVTTEEWVIDWSYVSVSEYAVFAFYVYPRGETLWDVVSVLLPQGTSGTTYSYAGVGEYYIEVTAYNIESWEIVISSP